MHEKKSACGRALTALAGVITLGAALVATPAGAAVLTFDGNICSGGQACTDGALIDKSYGDVAGVVDVQYLNLLGNPGADQLRFWHSDYNELTNVAWTDGGDTGSRAEIFIKPLNGQAVTLNGFDLGAYYHTQRTTPITILDGNSNLLVSTFGGVLIGENDLHTSFAFNNISSTSGIRIQWGPSAYNVGIDNIDFSVAPVPLPAPAWMLGGGLVALMARRRRA